MTSSSTKLVRAGNRMGILLFSLALLLLSAVPVQAQSVGGCVANFGGVIDGFVNPTPASQISIDGNCTIQNLPASNPLTSNMSFNGNNPTPWLVVFEPGATEIRIQWRTRLNTLLEELQKAPSVLWLSYIADTEDAALVNRRMEAIKRQLTQDAASDSQTLTIEPEVFWRLGGPPKRPNLPVPGSR